MAAYTLLDYVQTILSSLDSDEVNNINDTVESLQVANIVKTVFNDLQSRADLPEHYSLFELTATTNPNWPILMSRPAEVMSMLWVQYNCINDIHDTNPRFKDITFLPLDEFIRNQYGLNVSDDNIDSFEFPIGISGDTITFIFRTDKEPQYWTTFNDTTIIFDSYNKTVDVTLQKSKTRCYGRKESAFAMMNTFIPFVDRDLSTLLLNESKILAFSELKQVGHDVAKLWANRGWTKIQKQKRGLDQDRREIDRAPNYGRLR